MRRFVLEVVIFTLISMICFSVFGQPVQDWQDEDMVWNEKKGEWETHNKVRIPAPADRNGGNAQFPVYTDEWARYLPRSVRLGQREASQYHLSEAKRKLWAKEIITARAMEESERRRQLIAYRKASGWYGARRGGAHNYGNSLLRAHVMAVNNYMYRSRGYGY